MLHLNIHSNKSQAQHPLLKTLEDNSATDCTQQIADSHSNDTDTACEISCTKQQETPSVSSLASQTDAQVTAGLVLPTTDGPMAASIISSDSRLQQVLRLANRGLLLFPLQPQSKVPIKDFAWKDLATNDTEQVRVWYAQFPTCNWAVRTGPESKVFVFDIDGEEGRESLNSILSNECTLPPTLTNPHGQTARQALLVSISE